MRVVIQVGEKRHVVDTSILPPVGTKLAAHKHLYDGGTSPLLEVLGYEWQLEEAPSINGKPEFSILIKTRIVKE